MVSTIIGVLVFGAMAGFLLGSAIAGGRLIKARNRVALLERQVALLQERIKRHIEEGRKVFQLRK